MQKHLVKKTIEDKAEEIISRWHSLTRNKPVENPVVLKILQLNISQALIQKGIHPREAQDKAAKLIIDWGYECDGLSIDHPMVMEVLQLRIERILE